MTPKTPEARRRLCIWLQDSESLTSELEDKPSGELESAGVGAGEAEGPEAAVIHIDPDLIIRSVVPKGDRIGYILAIDTKDELGSFSEHKGATESTGQTIHAWTPQTIRCNARQVTDREVAGVAVRSSRSSAYTGVTAGPGSCISNGADQIARGSQRSRRHPLTPSTILTCVATEVRVRIRHTLPLADVLSGVAISDHGQWNTRGVLEDIRELPSA